VCANEYGNVTAVGWHVALNGQFCGSVNVLRNDYWASATMNMVSMHTSLIIYYKFENTISLLTACGNFTIFTTLVQLGTNITY